MFARKTNRRNSGAKTGDWTLLEFGGSRRQDELIARMEGETDSRSEGKAFPDGPFIIVAFFRLKHCPLVAHSQ